MDLKEVIKGKTILVTGGTGSFGHTIVKKLLPLEPKEIRIFSRDEYKQHLMAEEFKNFDHIKFFIGDVRDRKSIDRAMRGVDIVYHAAAMKHVPECEKHVVEAVLTNILGAQNVIDSAIHENVEKLIAISTDKAVEPINAMGMTKALQEKIVLAGHMRKGQSRTVLACVRYGNVIGSRGSVIPLFREQILNNIPLTLTDPDMTRFLLSLNEAVELVFQATLRAKGGEVFVMKMPSVKMIDLAKAMTKGLNKPTHPIHIVGTRVGEKKHELLVSKSEIPRAVEEENNFIILPAVKIEEVYNHYSGIGKTSWKEYSSDIVKILSVDEAVAMIGKEKWFENILPSEVIL